MHPFISLTAIALCLALTSCSSSRLVDTERVFEAGDHRVGSLIKSDVFLEEGAHLDLAYLANCRVFLSSGSSLTGLGRGVRESRIYYEDGADFPSNKISSRKVDNANLAYLDRFKNHLPTGPSSRGSAGRTAIYGGGYGYYPHYYHRSYRRRSHYSSRSNYSSRSYSGRNASVRSSSYRTRN